MKKYYREGTYDDCEGQQRLFELCMRLRYREVNGKGDEPATQVAMSTCFCFVQCICLAEDKHGPIVCVRLRLVS
jgi:hypothetical protein